MSTAHIDCACMDSTCSWSSTCAWLHEMCLQVRMSPDNMKAFILWSGLPESEDRLEQSLQSK